MYDFMADHVTYTQETLSPGLLQIIGGTGYLDPVTIQSPHYEPAGHVAIRADDAGLIATYGEAEYTFRPAADPISWFGNAWFAHLSEGRDALLVQTGAYPGYGFALWVPAIDTPGTAAFFLLRETPLPEIVPTADMNSSAL